MQQSVTFVHFRLKYATKCDIFSLPLEVSYLAKREHCKVKLCSHFVDAGECCLQQHPPFRVALLLLLLRSRGSL
jgi:hypothetical protein